MTLPQEMMPGSVSAAFFCPQARAPDEHYLAGLHSFLSQDKHGRTLLEEIVNLKTDRVWEIFAAARDDVAALRQGSEYVNILRDWAAEGTSGPLAAARSGIVALPLLLILQTTQYLRYLAHHGLSHRDFLAGVSEAGGLQGYCGGLPSAMAIACAKDEAEVVGYTAIAMRIVLGVGAYGEAADDTGGTGSTTLAMRLKYEGQGDDLTRQFPGTHVSAITEPRSVSIVGPAGKLHELFCFARDHEGLQVQKMEVRGKVHNPDNKQLAAELCRLCRETPCLQLPDASQLQVPVHSNRSGLRLLQGSLAEELVTTILASRCEWYSLLGELAKDLEQAQCSAPAFVYFGLTDCVPLTPFHKRGIRPTKTAAHGLIRTQRIGKFPTFPENAVAVVGAACRLPGASNLEELWSMLASGADRHQKLPTDRFDIHSSFRANQSGKFANERIFYGNLIDDVERFDNAFFGVNPREAANMDPQQRILLELAHEALENAGYLATHRREDGDNVGCFVGASFVEYLDNANAHPPTAYTSTGTIRAFLCGRISYYYGWSGPAEVIDTACSSSLVAINRACKAVQTGECRMALTGGINIITGMNNYLDLAKAGFLSPTGQCKPFDASADGYCRSDGAGLVVLKKLKHAIADGDAILGVIPGVATNQGGLSASITAPHSAAQQALYQSVLEQARLPPESVTYVETHGTGTQAGDPLEIESIRSIFGRKPLDGRQDSLFVGSIKGNIGHCETAAGVAGLLKVLAMIKHGQLPPQANHNRLNPKIAPLEPDGLAISRSLRDWKVPFRAALVNSYGAAGSNCALLCCEMPSQREVTDSTKSDDMALPLMLSAATEKSLLENARTLGTYLRQQRAEIDLADIALTLNERRRRFKFLASIDARNTKDAASLLEDLGPSDIFQPPQNSKPVVLLFSGQYDNKVGLDQSFYAGFPAFRSHIDTCDAEFKALGYPSIIPAIFETQALSDVVTLQCSIFAMQYACAQCWIGAGLRPSAIVGHSLGELTALAVSGALSLKDAVKLVAARAHLIGTHVWPEKGAMLALSSCSVQEFEELCSLLRQQSNSSTPPASLEIACYNAPTALVVVGTSAVIDAAENLLRTEPSLQKIRVRRLATSHGFHSALMDPILSDLTAVAQSLEWNEPKIQLEVCAPQPLGTIKEYSPSNHAREPVFFSEAIRRVESRLGGSAVWLEAGVDTPVVPMASKAVREPEAHTFLAMKTHGGLRPVDAVAGLVSRLWRSGLFASHWRLIRPAKGAREAAPVWLPPYQFEPTRHWLPNIDRVVEMQQTMSRTLAAAALEKGNFQLPPPPPQLVTRRNTEAAAGVTQFSINTESQRFRRIVGGHAVRSRPLCPASMYMECVTMALQLLLEDSDDDPFRRGASLVFEDLSITVPLGIEPQGEVVVQLEAAPGGDSWKFVVRKAPRDGASPRPREPSHANGVIALTLSPVLDAFQRLVSGPMDRIERRDADAERLMCKRAYSLFGRVVDYAPFFKGIRSIALSEREAVATIFLPDEQPSREESTAWKICDTVAVDAYIQVVGLLMNSDDSVAADEVVVMVGLDRVVMSPGCKTVDPSECRRVYARFGYGADQQPIGDVFVCTAVGELVVIFCGCRFAKLPISKLERTLDMANRHSSAQRTTTVPPSPPSTAPDSSSVTTEVRGTLTPAMSATPPAAPDAGESLLAMRELIAEYTGIGASDIPEEKILAELGLDSLASVEFAAELSSRFGVSISAEDLGESTLRDLYRHLGARSPPIPVSNLPRPEMSSAAIMAGEKPSFIPSDLESEQRFRKFLQILVDVTGARLEDIKLPDELALLGLDSLSSTDLKQELEENFDVTLDDILVEDTVQGLMAQLNITAPGSGSAQQKASYPAGIPALTDRADDSKREESKAAATVILGNPFDVLQASNPHFDSSARKNGFVNYWSNVARPQDELLVAYIVEAFAALGVDLGRASLGDQLPQIPYLRPKHDKLVPRLWEILQSYGLISIGPAGVFTLERRPLNGRSAAQLLEAFKLQFPDYREEADLIGLTGPKLAECLSGQADAVSLMFGSPASMRIMENYYGQSPMISTLTDQLVVFLIALLGTADKARPVRILEVGAGTGGTTRRLAAALASAGLSVRYTFTDISPSLVAKAKNTLSQHTWIEYATFNLEKEVPEAFRGQFDVVIGTNCVHATSNSTASCRRLRETLTPGGIVILSEVTHVIDWYDICFGLLDGWWLAEGGTAYPIQPAEKWMSTFAAAGFASASCSHGPTRESTSQQLLVACNKHWDVPPLPDDVGKDDPNSTDNNQDRSPFLRETMVYKEASGVQIHADVFFPTERAPLPMPIALMIHGGGHMTLSRKAIRPAQTQHLLANGFLPVSIDYRLCPEVNLIDGPIADVLDAYQWARTSLPQVAARRGVVVEPAKVVVVGWSTGGHLAMSLGWTAENAGAPPPAAVLSFYAPYNFESGELDSARLASLPGRKMSLRRIIATLPTRPITNYDNSARGDSTNLGWVRPGDPRSELVLALFKEGIGLPLMLSGLPPRDNGEIDDDDDLRKWLASTGAPSPERVASVSPLARLHSGQYNCPTYVIHGTSDEVAPFAGAQRFVAELAARGVRHGFLTVKGGAHIHDLALRPGTHEWQEQVAPGYQFLIDVVKNI